jgi:hypothetical protein
MVVAVVITWPGVATSIVGVEGTPLAVGTFDGLEARSPNGLSQSRAAGHWPNGRAHPAEQNRARRNPGLAPASRPAHRREPKRTLTLFRADDPECTPQVYKAGSGLVDQGGDVHVVRNEGDAEAVVYVGSFIPQGAGRRVDALAAGTCGL